MANNYPILDGQGVEISRRSEDIGGHMLDAVVLTDPAGAAVYLTPGMTRAGFQSAGAEQRILVQSAPPYSAAAFPVDTTHVMYSVSGGLVRVRFDGTNPAVAGWGHLFPAGDNGILPLSMAQAMKVAKVVDDAEIILTPLK